MNKLAALLIKHNVIDRAAIEDSVGYDGEATLRAVLAASIEVSVELEEECDKLRAEIERLKAWHRMPWNTYAVQIREKDAEIERLRKEVNP